MTFNPNLTASFQEIFQTADTPRQFFAPGRINLIGEHTDYNGGHVFPAAISYGTYALAVKRSDNLLRFYSMNFSENGIIERTLDDLAYRSEDDWANYPKGVLLYLQQTTGKITSGLDILFYGDIPNGAGLSSSASIELVTGVLADSIYGLEMERIPLVQLGQRVENEYIGVNSGIMDQFSVGMGKQGHAILLDCNTLDYEHAPVDLSEHVILIANTNKQRTLSGSKYNERRSECEAALQDLQQKLKINSLGELTPNTFEQHHTLISNPVHVKRARHAVYENNRTIEALKKLQKHDLAAFGELMNDSHRSLRDDYEVTGQELDTIVEAAWAQAGVLGARMTGAGFGGCAIALVEKDKADAVQAGIQQHYKEKIGYEATFYTATIGDGAKELA
ncbi:galactokinase [Terribacillus saccharophilus]|uniref:Galactokinase n=1 Tax=Terribacillus saccharophilus TaxID=361277 RepID=A0ABX4GUU8_9BACI|nr:galactokinase [Terribacillus saccharophilus]PAD34305.1 galactokinase [Terribacillus saccharophilus]PAD94883.1 galactokinase [Terribacillus saccharophilus]PAD98632.1 galactokinase [Terribacillus saccharophilus]